MCYACVTHVLRMCYACVTDLLRIHTGSYGFARAHMDLYGLCVARLPYRPPPPPLLLLLLLLLRLAESRGEEKDSHPPPLAGSLCGGGDPSLSTRDGTRTDEIPLTSFVSCTVISQMESHIFLCALFLRRMAFHCLFARRQSIFDCCNATSVVMVHGECAIARHFR